MCQVARDDEDNSECRTGAPLEQQRRLLLKSSQLMMVRTPLRLGRAGSLIPETLVPEAEGERGRLGISSVGVLLTVNGGLGPSRSTIEET